MYLSHMRHFVRDRASHPSKSLLESVTRELRPHHVTVRDADSADVVLPYDMLELLSVPGSHAYTSKWNLPLESRDQEFTLDDQGVDEIVFTVGKCILSQLVHRQT